MANKMKVKQLIASVVAVVVVVAVGISFSTPLSYAQDDQVDGKDLASIREDAQKSYADYLASQAGGYEYQDSTDDEYLNEFELKAKQQLLSSGVATESLTRAQIGDQTVRIMVELEATPAIDFAPTPDDTPETLAAIHVAEDQVHIEQEPVIDRVVAITGQRPLQSFGYTFNGFSTYVQVKQIEQLRSLAGVKNLTLSQGFRPLDASANEIGGVVNAINQHGLKGEGTVIAVIDTGIDANHKDMQLSDPSIAKLHQADVEAAIHGTPESLGILRGKFFTDKVPFGYNYADHNYNIVSDDDPHGTHVSGIIAGNGELTSDDRISAVQGVAPEAQLLAMRIFSEDGGEAMTEGIIEAIDDSVKLGADIINMSFGSTDGINGLRNYSPEAQAIAHAAEHGVIPVLATGNDGAQAFYSIESSTVSTPAIYPDSFAVASVNNVELYKEDFNIEDDNNQVLQGGEFTNWTCNKVSVCDFDQQSVVLTPTRITDEQGNDTTVYNPTISASLSKLNLAATQYTHSRNLRDFSDIEYSDLAFLPNYSNSCTKELSGSCNVGKGWIAPSQWGHGLEKDFEKYLELHGSNSLEGKVLVVEYPDFVIGSSTDRVANISFDSIGSFAKDYGVKSIIAITNEDVFNHFSDEDYKSNILPMILITKKWTINDNTSVLSLEDTLYTHYTDWKNGLLDLDAAIHFNPKFEPTENPYGGKVSSFSSYGPTSTLDFKPEIAGIGGHVYSTLPNNKYADESGTSMATPFVSGSLALVLQYIRKNNLHIDGVTELELAKTLVENTALPIRDTDACDGQVEVNPLSGSDELLNCQFVSPRRQGAGLIQVDRALENKVLLSGNQNGLFALREVRGNQAVLNATVTNFSDSDAQYQLDGLNGVQIEVNQLTAKDALFGEISWSQVDVDTNVDDFSDRRGVFHDKALAGATIVGSHDILTVNSKSSLTLTITIDLPSDEIEKGNWIEGYFSLVSLDQDSEHASLTAPYMGYWGNWTDAEDLLDNGTSDGKIYNQNASILEVTGNRIKGLSVIKEHENPAVAPVPFYSVTTEDDNKVIAKHLQIARDLSRIDWSVTDEQGNLVRNLGSEFNISRDHVASGTQVWSPFFDKKIYNPETGLFDKFIEEGKLYYIHAELYLVLDGAESVGYDWGIIADNTPPTLANLHFDMQDNDINTRGCILSGTITDNLATDGVVGFGNDGHWVWYSLSHNNPYIHADADAPKIGQFNTFAIDYNCNDILSPGRNNLTIIVRDSTTFNEVSAQFAYQYGSGLHLNDVSPQLSSSEGYYITTSLDDGYIHGSYTSDDGYASSNSLYANLFDAKAHFISSQQVELNEKGDFEVAVPMNEDYANNTNIVFFNPFAISNYNESRKLKLGAIYTLRDNIQNFSLKVYADSLPTGYTSGALYVTDPSEYGSIDLQGKITAATQYYLRNIFISNKEIQSYDTSQYKQYLDGWSQFDYQQEITGLGSGENIIDVEIVNNQGGRLGIGNPVSGINRLGILVQNYTPMIQFFNVSYSHWNGYNNYDYSHLEDGKLIVQGKASSQVHDLKIDGNDVEYSEDKAYFYAEVQLPESGIARIGYSYTDEEGNFYGDFLKFIVNKDFPVLNFDNSHCYIPADDGFDVYTNQDSFKVSGSISEKYGTSRVIINGEHVAELEDSFFDGIPDTLDESPVYNFSREYPLNTTTNVSDTNFVVTVTDWFGNRTAKTLHVHRRVYEQPWHANLQIQQLNQQIDGVNVSAKLVPQLQGEAGVPEGTTIEWSFDGNEYHPYTTSVNVIQDRSIYWRTVDEYGNTSEPLQYQSQGIENPELAQLANQPDNGSATASFVNQLESIGQPDVAAQSVTELPTEGQSASNNWLWVILFLTVGVVATGIAITLVKRRRNS